NDANGEDNRDGDNHNCSFNYGAEGPTNNRTIEKLRLRQIKNMLTTLMFSMGAPMLVSGDECRRTQRGNNNAYCQDAVISWFNWRLVQKNEGLLRFVRELIAFRREHPTIRLDSFLTGHPVDEHPWPDVSWYHPSGGPMQWDGSESSLIYLRPGVANPKRPGSKPIDLMTLLHPGSETRGFFVPEIARDRNWRLLIDTAAASPEDFFPDMDGPQLDFAEEITLKQRSTRCYVSIPSDD
ncbi:MAG: glycogen debranching enzyme, partial [Planctomycetales bacterium]